jgi:hypothetical protein
LALLRSGLIPSWAQNPSIGMRPINARARTASTKPSFRCVGELDRRINWLVAHHNHRVVEIVKEEKIAINGLYALMLPNLDLAVANRFFWKPEGQVIQGRAAAEVVRKALAERWEERAGTS